MPERSNAATVIDPPQTKVDLRAQSLEAALHAHCVKLLFAELVVALVGMIGKKLTAYIASIKDVRMVDKWMNGAEPYRGQETRLRTAYHVALLIGTREKPPVIQRWFMGLNPELDDRAAATLLREGEIAEVGPAVLRAARAFIV
ncbi:MAG TPA: DUF2384 domain-containing protein [Candidatus Angelobacter sp.]|jgi:hypothetical protein|nr:DUF2384 domain-containing protein [Candidatus Angelobacter sp.]